MTSSDQSPSHNVFVYGSFKEPAVVSLILECSPVIVSAQLHGYHLYRLKGRLHPCISPSENGVINGKKLKVNRGVVAAFTYDTPPINPCYAHAPFLPPIANPRLLKAYAALQAWKFTITSDPNGFTSNWCGPHVCNYTGVYCAPALDNPYVLTVAGIDLNHANIAGYLPIELGLLTDLALFHINSNRFQGQLPKTLKCLELLHELDVSNNKLSGEFPSVIFSLPSLKFLDIRFNEFQGDVPDQLFDLNLDALFINDNKFQFRLPKNIGNSPVSVLVLANIDLQGSCVPPSFYKMGKTLHELIISNSQITGCLNREIGMLNQLTVFDVSYNNLVGSLPETIGDMKSLEQLNIAHNKFSGYIPESICRLPSLENFTYSYNFFSGEPPACLRLQEFDDRRNCLPSRPMQRSLAECKSFSSYPIDCASFGCSPPSPPQMKIEGRYV
ncbi:hypothetical protein ARALYDRAFT_898761 [Arabidopsis lyrata subsp. lyrata]|uniref:Cell wall hydroxyproline-rich glycoprotein n=1 Tax=Arabidopsis lyrata subsp. lyrata TaxID=81972 RepID=D7L2F4_ARALL|nr:hypothetical protein ARALYDRAFT_898761 [Arabidopsis lyrata subsp. lyrata]